MSKILTHLRNWSESLFASKKAYIAEQSLPQFQIASEQMITCTDGYQQVIPTINGYVSIEAVDSDTDCHFRACYKDPDDTTDLISTSNYKWSTTIYSVYLPVRKGSSVVMVYSNSNKQPLRVRWISNIGGGILKENSRLFQGGLLCLKASLNQQLTAIAESFCRRATIASLRLFLSAKRKVLTLYQMTVWFCLQATAYSLRSIIKSVAEQYLCIPAMEIFFISQHAYLAQKVIRLFGNLWITKVVRLRSTFSTLALIKAISANKEAIYG